MSTQTTSTTATTSRGTASGRLPSVQRLDAKLLAVTILLHGPLDVGLAAVAWGLESNPLVLGMGLGPWVALKALAISGLVAAQRLARRDPTARRIARVQLALLAALGAVAVGSNLAVLAGVMA